MLIDQKESEKRKRTDRLLDDLTSNLALQQLCQMLSLGHILRNLLLNHIRDIRIHIRRLIRHIQIDLSRTLVISTQSSIMLQPIASTILVNGQVRLVFQRIGRLQRVSEFDARGETLPRIVGLGPPALSVEGLFGTVVYVSEMLVDESDSVVEAGLVETVQVGQVDFEPSKTAFAERFRFCEFEQATREVVADVVQMGREGVGAATEIDVVGEVEGVSEEL